MNNLFLSLGHNSSAISKDDSNIIGYEQERIDGVKSSSQFPIDAINEINKNNDYKTFDNIYISHWFDTFNIDNVLSTKYVDKKYLVDKNIITHTKDFTHHDAHCFSSYSFYKYWSRKEAKICDDNLHFIVADGFGNNQECLSIYILEDSQPKLIHRTNGYNKSLGLMYQYATSFCGMKENQDEYKFLGYESHIDSIKINKLKDKLLIKSDNVAYGLFNDHLFNSFINIDSKGFINIDDLLKTKKNWYIIFDEVLSLFNGINFVEFDKRVIIGFFIQNVIERFFERIIDYFNIENVCLSGGCFYNVKLNNSILKNIKGYLSIVPICGDQGASIGFQEKYEDSQFNWENINFGKRNFYGIGNKSSEKILVSNDEDIIIGQMTETILNKKIANFVQENMEYGPRALGNTSSLLLPFSKICDINNKANDRNEVMPNAPIILEENKDFFFEKNQYDRIIGSDKFMIITYDYKEDLDIKYYSGVSHKYPSLEKYSGRPQFISKERNPIIYQVLKNIENELGIRALVNTSFNYHGVPIVFNTQQIMNSFNMQIKNSDYLKLFVKI